MERYQAGNRVTGVINNITDLGIFVTLPNKHSGLVHHGDFGNNWPRERRQYKVGQEVRVVVVHIHKGRFNLFTVGHVTLNKIDAFVGWDSS